jgi:hypothetical protein
VCLAVGERDFEAFLESVTPEQMDHWEAHFRVKAEADAIAHRAAYSAAAGVPYDETKWMCKLWVEDDDE